VCTLNVITAPDTDHIMSRTVWRVLGGVGARIAGRANPAACAIPPEFDQVRQDYLNQVRCHLAASSSSSIRGSGNGVATGGLSAALNRALAAALAADRILALRNCSFRMLAECKSAN
jgi:hypothetical protein